MPVALNASDAFTRADGALIGSAPDNAAGGTGAYTWAGDSGFAIASHQLVNTVTARQVAYLSGATATDVQRVGIVPGNGDTCVVARYDVATGRCYFLQRVGGAISLSLLYPGLGGEVFGIGSWSGGVAGLSLELDCNGSTLTAYQDGVSLGSYSDGTVPSGVGGVIALGSGTFSADDFTYKLPAVATASKLGITSAAIDPTISRQTLPSFVVAVQDAGGSTVAGDTSTITVAVVATAGEAYLSGTVSKAASGTAAFNDLSVEHSDDAVYHLVATSPGLTQAVSADITGTVEVNSTLTST